MLPDMCDDRWPRRPADLARVPIPGQSRGLCPIHVSQVVCVQRDMQAHAEGHWQQLSLAEPKQEDKEQGCGSVKRSGRRVLGRVRLMEEAHRRHEVKLPLLQAEPDIVVGVD